MVGGGGMCMAGWLVTCLLRRVEVHGPSMLPALVEGDRLLVGPKGRLRAGDVVVLAEPGAGGLLAVKRVVKTTGRLVEVRGDNPAASLDSRRYGPVPTSAVIGRVWWCYHPPGRSGRVGRSRSRGLGT